MFIFDQLRKDDPQLRVVALVVLGGLGVLLAGLWWVQVVSAREYQANLETQSFRTVRIPAVRGAILDRNGKALAENRATYNVSLYLEELRQPFDAAYFKEVERARNELKQRAAELEKKLQRKLKKAEKKQFVLSVKDKNLLRQKARLMVASNVVAQISQRLRQSLVFDGEAFERHYETRLALPFPILSNLDPRQIALFEEQLTSPMGVDLEVQSTRTYPYQTTAAHVLGRLAFDNSSETGEEAFFSFRLPDFRGIFGIEAGFDKQLRGTAGTKSVLVNNVGYRQTENIWSPAEPGQNAVLTLDLAIQQAAEKALVTVDGPTTRGAVVVLDVHTGDILALVSAPTFNPNFDTQGFPPGERQRLLDPALRPQINRATYARYAPGSVFKPVVGLAALEAGLDPNQTYTSAPDPQNPGHAAYYVGNRRIRDLAPPGPHNFRDALKLSSNCYFIANGLRAGIERIVEIGQRLHLAERSGLPTRQDTPGLFPSLEKVHSHWTEGETANICIGQGAMAVTPMQMAVMTAAIANGGTVLWPRLVQELKPQDPAGGAPPTTFPPGRIRDELGVKPANLKLLREAMRADVEDPDGTGRKAAVPGVAICGKTGTAEIKDEHGVMVGHTTWFVSFAPYEQPLYAVVVMVERDGPERGFGGTLCAPVAHAIYLAIKNRGQIPNVATVK
jgi:penicillin-binding protein 2